MVSYPYTEEVVRGMLLLRANALCGGVSGVRPLLVEMALQRATATKDSSVRLWPSRTTCLMAEGFIIMGNYLTFIFI